MIGIDVGNKGRKVFKAFSVNNFSGGPDSPPVSPLFSVETLEEEPSFKAAHT